MMQLFQETTLDPRDALHLASMYESNITSIISEDSDFNKIREITRLTAKQEVKTLSL